MILYSYEVGESRGCSLDAGIFYSRRYQMTNGYPTSRKMCGYWGHKKVNRVWCTTEIGTRVRSELDMKICVEISFEQLK